MSEKVLNRILKINLPKGQSAFLWGPRKSGKTTFLRLRYPKSLYYDLLETDTLLRFEKEPNRLREEILNLSSRKELVQPVIIDEIQKVPSLLNEVHLLIEKYKVSFLLCGSSARKLKRAGTNLLGGRAWRYELFPFTSNELGKDFDLIKALNRGLIPSHYLDEMYSESLRAYVNDYLKEEIRDEGIVRNVPAFSRFLDAAALSNGEMINYSNIARDCGVDSKTTAEYYQILEDTLLGTFIEPYRKKKKRLIIQSKPKFYLFDVGITGSLVQRIIKADIGIEFGRAFEHFILMEILAHRSYSGKHYSIAYWRTKKGEEVDFILDGGRVALEVKSSKRVDQKELRGILNFSKEHKPDKRIVVSNETVPRKTESGIDIIPYRMFLNMLWENEI